VRRLPLSSVLPQARGLRPGDPPRGDGVTGRRLLGPLRLSVRALAGRWGRPGLRPTRLPSPHAVARGPPGCRTRPGGGGVWLAAPSVLSGVPGTRQGQAGCPAWPCPCHAWRWPLLWGRSQHGGRAELASQTREARGAFARRARHAASAAPSPAAAQPPPLGGWPPPHGACQEPAAHLGEWSTTLRSQGSLGAGTSQVFPPSSLPLSRRTATLERTLLGVGSTAMLARPCVHMYDQSLVAFCPS